MNQGLANSAIHQSTNAIHPLQVENLEKYGASLEMPKEAVKAQVGIIFKALRKKFGFLQVSELKRCEGDIFENFKKMNIALFERTTKDGTWLMEGYKDEPDKLTIRITTCANVELFNELEVPELGRFGCDHDVAGFSAIEEDVNCEFRRFCTIANGDDHCLFEFYRRGTAPDNAHLNI